MSSYYFTNTDAGPPSVGVENGKFSLFFCIFNVNTTSNGTLCCGEEGTRIYSFIFALLPIFALTILHVSFVVPLLLYCTVYR